MPPSILLVRKGARRRVQEAVVRHLCGGVAGEPSALAPHEARPAMMVPFVMMHVSSTSDAGWPDGYDDDAVRDDARFLHERRRPAGRVR